MARRRLILLALGCLAPAFVAPLARRAALAAGLLAAPAWAKTACDANDVEKYQRRGLLKRLLTTLIIIHIYLVYFNHK